MLMLTLQNNNFAPEDKQWSILKKCVVCGEKARITLIIQMTAGAVEEGGAARLL